MDFISFAGEQIAVGCLILAMSDVTGHLRCFFPRDYANRGVAT